MEQNKKRRMGSGTKPDIGYNYYVGTAKKTGL
jgi:hypothetical protein